MRLPAHATTPGLKRSIGLLHATSMVVGIIIGASIFVQPAEVSRFVPGTTGMLAVWVAAGLLTFCGSLVCAQLAASMPLTGGIYVFLRETVSPAIGFLWGWSMFWSVHSGIIAATAVIFARYVAYFAGFGDAGIRVVAIAAVLCLSAVNYVGVRPGSIVQTAIAIAKLSGIAAIAALVALLPAPVFPSAAAGAPPAGVRNFLLAVSAALFTFGGWHMVTYAAGEARDPAKTIPRALLIGTAIVAACYLAMNIACLTVLPLDRVIASTHVAADAASALVGPRGAAAVAALVLISSLGVVNGVILSGPRVYLTMAQDGLLFPWLAGIHPRLQTPHRAIVVQAVWASVLVATGTYRALFTRVVYTEWLFFALMSIGLMRLRRRIAIVPLLFMAASFAIVINQVLADPVESATGFLLVAAGLPVYALLARRRARLAGVATHASD